MMMLKMSLKNTILKNVSPKNISQTLTLVAVFIGVGMTTACTKKTPDLSSQPNIELIQDMMDQPALKAQDHEPSNPTKASSRIPPEGTVPVGYTPYKYAGNAAEAAAKLKNPYAGNTKAEILELGRRKYEIYCAVCHGYTGAGDGPVAPKMALKPPPVISDKIKGVTDGAIYHIITDGQGVMSSYAYQLVNENDRWAIVNYVRSLQKLSGQKVGSEKATDSAAPAASPAAPTAEAPAKK